MGIARYPYLQAGRGGFVNHPRKGWPGASTNGSIILQPVMQM